MQDPRRRARLSNFSWARAQRGPEGAGISIGDEVLLLLFRLPGLGSVMCRVSEVAFSKSRKALVKETFAHCPRLAGRTVHAACLAGTGVEQR